MTRTLFLASYELNALPQALSKDPHDTSLLFIPTAGALYDDAPWVEHDRDVLHEMGFDITELNLEKSDDAKAARVAEVIWVAGGNTYFLLQHLQRTGFAAELAANPACVYGGGSAGAVVAAPDIAYIEDMDDRAEAPDLQSTVGLALADVFVIPHLDQAHYADKANAIAAKHVDDPRYISLNDNEAVLVKDGLVTKLS